MFLKRFVFVNWGNIPNLEFDLGPVNLFSGGNGSGKTTAADAIQTVLTAAHENLFQYNPGQDETTQRGRGGKRVRTLASYVLGCDDGSYARLDPTDGYLAAVFHPTRGEDALPFTAIVAVRAWLDQGGSQSVARQEESAFFLLSGVELALSHFQREDASGRYVVPLDHLPNHLATEFGKRVVERYDTKKGYLRRLYAALRGRSDAVTEREAVQAARAFSRFMAYKPVSSINQFVAEEILERRDLGEAIRNISAQLKTIHAMEREAQALNESIALLTEAGQHALAYISGYLDLTALDYSLARRDHLERQREHLEAKQRRQELRRRIQENEQELALAGHRYEQLHEQLVALEAQRQGVDALRERDRLSRERDLHGRRMAELGRELLAEDARWHHNLQQVRLLVEQLAAPQLAQEVPQLAALELRSLVRHALERGRRGDIDLQTLMQQDLTADLSALERHLDQARSAQRAFNELHQTLHRRGGDGHSLRDLLFALDSERRRRAEQLGSQHRQRQQEIDRLEAHQVSYPPYVERALATLRNHCPTADPRVLCDHVEVTDPQWQAAIEGYLGGARFGILVQPEFEAEAIRLVRTLSGRDNKARVIQGHKARADADRLQPPADSLLEVLTFTHSVARDYLTASYGSVVRVADADALRHTRRGITREGMGSGNYTLFRCDLADTELVFGAAARGKALAAKRQELGLLGEEWQQAHERAHESGALLAAVDGVAPLTSADKMTELLAARRELGRIEALLERIELGEHAELERRLATTRGEERKYLEQQRGLDEQAGQLKEQLRAAEGRARQFADQQAASLTHLERCESDLRALHNAWPEFDPEQRLLDADRHAEALDPTEARPGREEQERRLHKTERELEEAIDRHNRHCRPGDAVLFNGFDGNYDANLFRQVCAVRGELDRVYNLLRNNILADKREQLARLKESFNSAFVTHLCHAIWQAIKDGERQIEQLNRELTHHHFGADRELFRFASEWIPEYRDYARFFEEVVKNPSLGDEMSLFEAKLSQRSSRVLAEIMTMLLDEDEHKAQKELERIADYRNYRRYEIYKEVEGKPPIPLSEYGTGSGGQLETPAYIIRSAAITSAFRFSEGKSHLRMVLVDEAFSKMDEVRSREVIDYLTESLGLQLVFIMPTSKCGPFLDLVSNEFVFAKVPSPTRGQLRTRVLVDRKSLNRERIAELWERHRRTVFQQAELDFMADL